MWDLVDDAKMDAGEATARELELQSRDDFWGSLCQQGSQVKRSRGDKRSVLTILNDLVAFCDRAGYTTMQIQEELVGQGKELHETLAGQEILDMCKQRERRCAEEVESAKLISLPRESVDHAKTVSELQRELQTAKRGQEELRVSLQVLATEKERTYAHALSSLRNQQESMASQLRENDRRYKQLEKERAHLLSTFEKQKEQWQREHAALHRDVRQGRQARPSLDRYRQRIEAESLRIAKNLEDTKKRDEEEKARIEEKNRVLKKRELCRRNLLPLLGILAGAGAITAGAVTGVTPLLGLGAGFAFENARNLRFSRRERDREGKDEAKLSLSALSSMST